MHYSFPVNSYQFPVILSHLSWHTMVLYTTIPSIQKENIVADFQSKLIDTASTEYITAYNSLIACVLLSLIGLGLEMVFIITGITMFYDTSNFIIICLHAVGIIVYSEFIIGAWPYYQLWYFWAGFILLPLLMEIIASCFGNILYGTAFTRRKSRKGN